jgi:phasin family protein
MATSSSKSTAAKKDRPAAESAMENMQEAFAKPLKGLTERLQNLNVEGAAGAILDSGRKDLEALVKATEKSYQGLQSVVQRQTAMLKQSIEEWQGAVKGMTPTEPQENIKKLDALSKAAFKRAIDDIKELSELAAKSQAESFDLVRQRIQSNVDEVSKLLKFKQPK